MDWLIAIILFGPGVQAVIKQYIKKADRLNTYTPFSVYTLFMLNFFTLTLKIFQIKPLNVLFLVFVESFFEPHSKVVNLE